MALALDRAATRPVRASNFDPGIAYTAISGVNRSRYARAPQQPRLIAVRPLLTACGTIAHAGRPRAGGQPISNCYEASDRIRLCSDWTNSSTRSGGTGMEASGPYTTTFGSLLSTGIIGMSS